MKVLVTYLSNSGNTKRMAEAIFEGVQGTKMLKPMDEVEDAGEYDLVFVGFPIIGRGAPRKAKKFLSQQAKGKDVALFVTHGMPESMEMLKPMLENCRSAARGANVVGSMDCQGKMVDWMAKLMRLYPNAEVRNWVKGGPESIGAGRPGKDELARAREFGSRLTMKRGQTIVA